MNLLAVTLSGETDWEGFSQAVRFLVRQGVSPDRVIWRTASHREIDLFDAVETAAAADLPTVAALQLPASFVETARLAFLHKAHARFDLLYRTAWRVVEDRRRWQNPLASDRMRLERMGHQVRREMHWMKAFVRFRRLVDAAGQDHHVAWFEPQHYIVEAVAPFFVGRFGAMRWALLTPRVSASWDGNALSFKAGARKEDAPPADAGEALWIAYYQSIFNPTRLKVRALKRGMPVRYWANLSEAASTGPLTRRYPEGKPHD
ncbi:MAG TPA: TIGR03915 family putative DNA repair protein [Candidatus Competibacter sp.]|nr:TIGR03915 family putative DNA repair protein [Candidatus Competibacter sp.]